MSNLYKYTFYDQSQEIGQEIAETLDEAISKMNQRVGIPGHFTAQGAMCFYSGQFAAIKGNFGAMIYGVKWKHFPKNGKSSTTLP